MSKAPSPEIYYNSNCNHKHSWGPPEIIVAYPDRKLALADLYDIAQITLNELRNLVENLLQHICQEGYPEVDCVDLNNAGEFIVSAKEMVYSGWRDHDFQSSFTVRLTHRPASDEIHFFLSDNAMLSFQDWRGEGPASFEEWADALE